MFQRCLSRAVKEATLKTNKVPTRMQVLSRQFGVATKIGLRRMFSDVLNPDMFDLGQESREEGIFASEMYSYKEKNFIDRVRLNVTGGKGGMGCSTHENTRKGLRGRASGGSGGNGGAIYIRADMDEPDLSYIRSKHITGNQGRHGTGDSKSGANGKDLHYSVPVGTAVYELIPIPGADIGKAPRRKGQSTLDNFKRELIAELGTRGEQVRVVQGGKGGQGNMHDHNIKERLYGEEGDSKLILLELKVIADIGFVGMPNAGKSTLLGALTRCRPKIAPYAFTTLSPNLGKLKFIDDKSVTLADIPGLIEDSSKNKGLGFEFLKHVEKTKSICFVLDMSNTHDHPPWKQYEILLRELGMFSNKLLEKNFIVAGNKCDLKGAFLNYEEFRRRTGISPIMISAMESEGLEDLVTKIRDTVIGKP